MKIGRRRRRERGSATLVVFALLLIMAALALGNQRTLHQLHQELDLIERHQLKNPESAKPQRTIGPVGLPLRGEPALAEAMPDFPRSPASPEAEVSPPAVPSPEAQPEP
jgi:hypothetical protein